MEQVEDELVQPVRREHVDGVAGLGQGDGPTGAAERLHGRPRVAVEVRDGTELLGLPRFDRAREIVAEVLVVRPGDLGVANGAEVIALAANGIQRLVGVARQLEVVAAAPLRQLSQPRLRIHAREHIEIIAADLDGFLPAFVGKQREDLAERISFDLLETLVQHRVPGELAHGGLVGKDAGNGLAEVLRVARGVLFVSVADELPGHLRVEVVGVPALAHAVDEEPPIAGGRFPLRPRLPAERSQIQQGLRIDPVSARWYLIEFHRRFALPTACLVLALVGIPLGLSSKKSGKSGETSRKTKLRSAGADRVER
ncbi:MAG: LptF/LptG family permease, partial [Acidobacteriia bacterium]|nr:LptF/LptG family permease [Terriglobia bacterium]